MAIDLESIYNQTKGKTGTIPFQGSSSKIDLESIYNQTKKAQSPSFLQSAGDYVKSSFDQVQNLAKQNPLEVIGKAIISPFVETAKAASDSFNRAVDAGSNIVSDMQNGTGTTASSVADFAHIFSGVAGTLFSPVTGLVQTAEKIPVVRQVVDALNIPFTVTGIAGSYASGKIIDAIPDSIVSKESKDIIKPAIQEVGALAGQVLLGGKIMGKLGDVIRSGQEVTPEITRKLVVESQNEVSQVKINTPQSKMADYSKSQGYEPYTSPDQLPVIQTGSKGKELPTIQIGTKPSAPVKGDLTYVPIKSPDVLPSQYIKSDVTPQVPITKPITTVEPIVPPREPGVAKSASDINQTLVRQGFDALPIEEQAKYTPQSYKADAQKLIDTPIEDIKAMVKGEKPMTVNPQIAFNVLEKYATEKGDVQLLRDMAKSPITTKLSEAGQTLGGHGFNDNPNSAVKIIQDVQKSRESRPSIVKTKKVAIDEVKAEIKKTSVTKRQTWEDFINSVKCNY